MNTKEDIKNNKQIKAEKIQINKNRNNLIKEIEENKIDQVEKDYEEINLSGSIDTFEKHENFIEQYKTIKPENSLKEKILPLEQKLFSLINLKYGVDVIYEDINLVDDIGKINENYYIHLLRNVNLDPKKDNFLLFHGFMACSACFVALLPYFLSRFNVFIPDIIGMGLSARPQIEFTSSEQCTTYFIDALHILIKKIFFQGKYNIKTYFYLGSHSLGGYFAGHYAIKYPIGIKKLLFFSPAGITDTKIKGTDIHKEAGCCFGCLLSLSKCIWCCQPKVRTLYNCCCCRPFLKCYFRRRYEINIDQDYIRNNEDSTPFFVDSKQINEIIGQLTGISMEYPNDLNHCAYYIFSHPPPSVALPLENDLLNKSKLKCIFIFGKIDWMDRTGALRLQKKNEERFKVFILSKDSHRFITSNAKEVESIVDTYF